MNKDILIEDALPLVVSELERQIPNYSPDLFEYDYDLEDGLLCEDDIGLQIIFDSVLYYTGIGKFNPPKWIKTWLEWYST